MVKKLDIKSKEQVEKISDLACHTPYEVWLSTDTVMLDARSLFRWALENLGKKTVAVPGEVLSSVNLEYAFQQDQLLLAACLLLPDFFGNICVHLFVMLKERLHILDRHRHDMLCRSKVALGRHSDHHINGDIDRY